jgi:spermidine synthase
MAASGFAGLGYQIVWTRQLSLGLGHEAAAVLATITAFFGGLAVGAFALGRRIERSAHPLRWYAACEAVVCVWGLVLAGLMAPACGWLLERIGERPAPAWQWAVSFLGSFLLLLPSTAAMGATLPAMERATAALSRRSAGIASLYAANTAGAVLGVVTAAFWLVPALGLVRTAVACAMLNLLCAAAAEWLSPGSRRAPAQAAADAPRRSRLPWLLAVTGLLGVGYEVLAVRVLSQVAEDTVYTFATLLAVYLVGTALGAAAWRRWAWSPGAAAFRATGEGARHGGRLLLGLAAACLAGALGLWNAEVVLAAATRLFGGGQPAALAAEAAVAVAAFLPPTLAMGAVFSALSSAAREEGIGFSRCLAINTVGAALAPLAVGVVLLPLIGAKSVMVLIVLGYVALAAGSAGVGAATGSLAAAALAVALLAPPLAFVDVPAGGRLLSYREGSMAAVSVVEDAEGVRRLRIDNRAQEGSSATVLADARQALLPVLLHRAPHRALFLGLGTGITATAASWDRSLEVDAVEQLPEVIDASPLFRADADGEATPARLHVIAADARRFVRAATQRYDVIVADNVHPARSGTASLYTAEHFAAVRSRLAPGGLFCQWLPLHQLDLDTLRTIVASFRTAFPEGWALLATHSLQTPVIGLVAHADGARFDARAIEERLRHAQLSRPPEAFGLQDKFALLGGFVAGPHALARFSAGAPLNTDDRPVVAYLAPRITYAPEGTPGDRLLALLRSLEIQAAELVEDPADPGELQRLEAYWRARDVFLAAGLGVRPSGDVRQMLSQVREPLLAALRTSADFRPAYDPLLRMADALAGVDAAAGRALLRELADLQPRRPEASRALQRLASPAP